MIRAVPGTLLELAGALFNEMAGPQPDTLLTAAVSLFSLSVFLSPSLPHARRTFMQAPLAGDWVNQDKKWNVWTQHGIVQCAFPQWRNTAPELPEWARVILRRFSSPGFLLSLWLLGAHDVTPGTEAAASPNIYLVGELWGSNEIVNGEVFC